MGQSRLLICLFSSFSHYNSNNTNWRCASDSNPRLQDGRQRRYHGAMVASTNRTVWSLLFFYNKKDSFTGIRTRRATYLGKLPLKWLMLTHSATLVRYLPTYLPIYLSLSFKRLHVFQLSSIIPPHLLLFLYITFVKVTSPKLSPSSTLSLSQMTFPRIVEWKTAFLSFSVGLLQTRWRILLSFNSCVNH